ncbi:fatty acid desaturase [Gammaproteobacteria bacterium]|nr:fatty acid desaturase [Gammaproteobacteria bacterium]
MYDNTSHQVPAVRPIIDQQTLGSASDRCTPPTRPSDNRASVLKDRDRTLYGELRNRLARAGCFHPAPWAYGIKIALILLTGALGYIALLTGPETGVRTGLVLLIAFASVQAGFIAHEAGDGSITSNRRLASCLHHILMSFVSALSSSYFRYLHKVHHLTLQRGARGLGAGEFSVNPYEIGWLKKLVSFNGTVFATATVCLRGLTFRLESIRYVLRNQRKTKVDRILMTLHALLWLVLPIPFIGVHDTIVNYGLVTLFIGPYAGIILILNHEGMSKAQPLTHTSMIERITHTTRNLGRSRWSDFFFGGVNNHIEHHLFPQIPATRLRKARAITKEFCGEHGIPYSETKFVRALAEAVSYFRTVPPARLAAEALS